MDVDLRRPPTCTLSFDFGTTSVKTALMRDAEILAEANESYPVEQRHPGWAEQDPAELWSAAGRTSAAVMEAGDVQPHEVEAVTFVAPWKAVIPVSEEGQVLYPAIIWMDSRAEAEAQALNDRFGRFVGTEQEYWPRLMWVKNRLPEVWDSSRWMMGMVTYLKWRATGEVFTDPSDDFAGSPDTERARYFHTVMEAAGLNDDVWKLPPSRPAAEPVGELSAEAAAHLCLPAGIPVMGGFGDMPAITYGCGASGEGDSHIYFGTSSWFAVATSHPERLDPPLLSGLNGEKTLAVYPLQTGCLAYDWIVEELYGHRRAHLDDGFQEFINAEVSQVPAGSENLLATHWLNGELPPLSKNAKGLFLNLTTLHDKRHMVRAVMESLCYTHRASIERFEHASGTTVAEITAVGGGASSAVWMQMLADILGRRVRVPQNPRYTGVIGAYHCSLVGLRRAAGLEEAAEEGPPAKAFSPDPSNREIYDRLFQVYGKLFPALREIFEELNGKAVT